MSTYNLGVASPGQLGTWVLTGGALPAILTDGSDATFAKKSSGAANDSLVFTPVSAFPLPTNETLRQFRWRVRSSRPFGASVKAQFEFTRFGAPTGIVTPQSFSGPQTTGTLVGPWNSGMPTGTMSLRFIDLASAANASTLYELEWDVNSASVPLAPTISSPSGAYVDSLAPLVTWTHNDSLSATVTNRASAGTTRTLTFASHSMQVGNDVTVATGIANYDGTAKITAVTSTTIVYTAPNGAILAEGTTAQTGTATIGEGLSQDGYQVRIFTAAQYGIGGFDPSTSPATYDSGQVTSSTTSISPPILANNATYRAYVRTAKIVVGSLLFGAWSFSAFSTAVTVAGSSITALLDSVNSRVTLSMAGFGNLLSKDDSTFESTVGSWIGNGNCSTARSTLQAFDGTASLAITATGAGTFNAITSTRYLVVPGQAYSATAQVRTASAVRGMAVQINWFDSVGAFISNASGTVVADTAVGWTNITVTGTAPANAVTASPSIVANGGAAAEVHFADSIAMHPGSTPAFSAGGVSAYSFTLTRQTGNLLTLDDSNIESSIGGWAGNGNCTVARTVAQAIDAGASLAITATGAGTFNILTSNRYAVVANQPYSATAQVRAASTVRGMTLQINWFDSAGAFITNAGGTTVADTATGWTNITVTGTAPANAVTASPSIVANGGAAAEVHFADSISLVAGSTPFYSVGGVSPVSLRPPLTLNAAQTVTVQDCEAPRGTPSTYAFTLTGTTANGSLSSVTQRAMVTPANDGTWWLKAVSSPTLNKGSVRVLQDPQETRVENTGVFRLDGRSDTVVVAGQTFGDDLTFQIYTSTASEFEAIKALLVAQSSLLLQEPFTDSTGTGLQRYLRITERSWSKQGVSGSPRRVFAVTALEVGRGY